MNLSRPYSSQVYPSMNKSQNLTLSYQSQYTVPNKKEVQQPRKQLWKSKIEYPLTRHQLLEQLRGPTPGPGSYNTEKYRNTLGSNVTIKGRIESKPLLETPGPGAYELAAAFDYVRPRSAGGSMGRRPEMHIDKDISVGPGSYNLQMRRNERKGFTFQGRYNVNVETNPVGPEDVSHAYRMTHKQMPLVSMHFSGPPKAPKDEGPGFTYNHQRQHITPGAGTFAKSRIKKMHDEGTPGVGAYDIRRKDDQRGPRFSFSGRWEVGNRF